MSFEVESKYRTNRHVDILQRLIAMGAEAEPEVAQEDVYLNHPARDFAQTNEAFRIRRIGAANLITYKGPKRNGPTKTREEIELPFEDGQEAFEQLLKLFTNLGFRKVADVRKTRHACHLTFRGLEMQVVLDTAEGLGEYVEVEAIAATEADLPAAQTAVVELARELELTDLEPRSYLRMHLEAMIERNAEA